jgi:bifunctional DNA-binding transcriptional regulator/antitoxin component of YhaV-PrlF toxin-antitoxin module
MGCSTKIQHIARKSSEQFYVTIPSALARALELKKGETLEWVISDKGNLFLVRPNVPPDPDCVKKKRPLPSTPTP